MSGYRKFTDLLRSERSPSVSEQPEHTQRAPSEGGETQALGCSDHLCHESSLVRTRSSNRALHGQAAKHIRRQS